MKRSLWFTALAIRGSLTFTLLEFSDATLYSGVSNEHELEIMARPNLLMRRSICRTSGYFRLLANLAFFAYHSMNLPYLD